MVAATLEARPRVAPTIAQRVDRLGWPEIEADLWNRGWSRTAPLLTRDECDGLVSLYGQDGLFRSRADMARHRFGEGEYKYLASPLPLLVAELRTILYPPLARVANAWARALEQRALALRGSRVPSL